MSVAVVDVREWQNVLDLKTGKKTVNDTIVVAMVKEVLQRHAYPGDTDLQSNRWVTDTALDLIAHYDPQLVFISYAQQYFSTRFTLLPEITRQAMYDAVFAEIDRFKKQSGFPVVVVGTGDMIPVAGSIDLSKLDGLAISSSWATRYAGLYGISEADMDYIKKIDQIERVVGKEEFLSIFHGKPEDGERLPDYQAVSRQGFAFKSHYLRQLVMVPAYNDVIPVSVISEDIASITDISNHILTRLNNGKVALVLVEGIGAKDFRIPYKLCANGRGWFYYEPGEAQYLAITQGKHQFFAYPPGYRYYLEDDENKKYPFSGYFSTIPDNTLGSRFSGRSIAVGNRSMFMHTTTGTDIAIECFARNLYNQGCLGVVHRDDKYEMTASKEWRAL